MVTGTATHLVVCTQHQKQRRVRLGPSSPRPLGLPATEQRCRDGGEAILQHGRGRVHSQLIACGWRCWRRDECQHATERGVGAERGLSARQRQQQLQRQPWGRRVDRRGVREHIVQDMEHRLDKVWTPQGLALGVRQFPQVGRIEQHHSKGCAAVGGADVINLARAPGAPWPMESM
jgi:hypothetical protein